jgi:hypothetical protein
MLQTRNRSPRNPYFHFHPMHSTFSLIAALVLFGLIAWTVTRGEVNSRLQRPQSKSRQRTSMN